MFHITLTTIYSTFPMSKSSQYCKFPLGNFYESYPTNVADHNPFEEIKKNVCRGVNNDKKYP